MDIVKKLLSGLSFIVIVCFCSAAMSDTILLKAPGDAKPKTVAKDAFIQSERKNDEEQVREVFFFYWHSRKQILIEEHLIAQEGDSILLERSDPEKTIALLKQIIEKGIRAEVTDAKGTTSQISCLRVEYTPPRGYMVLGYCPEDDTEIRLEVKGQRKRFGLAELRSVEFIGKDKVDVMTKDGKNLQGKWVPPGGACERMILKGITNEGKTVAIDLDDIVKISLPPRPKVK